MSPPRPLWKMFNRFSFSPFFWCAIERYDVSYYAPFFASLIRRKNFITQTKAEGERRWKCFRCFHHHLLLLVRLLPPLVSGIRVAKNLRWKLKIMLFKMIPSTQLKRSERGWRYNSSIWVIRWASITRPYRILFAGSLSCQTLIAKQEISPCDSPQLAHPWRAAGVCNSERTPQ